MSTKKRNDCITLNEEGISLDHVTLLHNSKKFAHTDIKWNHVRHVEIDRTFRWYYSIYIHTNEYNSLKMMNRKMIEYSVGNIISMTIVIVLSNIFTKPEMNSRTLLIDAIIVLLGAGLMTGMQHLIDRKRNDK